MRYILGSFELDKGSYFNTELNHTLKIEKDENELYIKIEKGIVKIISKLQFDNRI